MSRNESVHPAPENLLRFVDGELSPRESAGVRQHLEACWQCRAEKEEMERAAAECVRYRKIEAALLPEPPQPWFDIRREFSLLESAPAPSLAERISGFVSSVFSSPMRLAPTGMALLAIGWMTYSFRYAPAAQAAALLDRAAAAQTKVLKPRRVQISTAQRKFTRLIAPAAVAAAAVGQDEELKALFLAAHYDWDDPLSAQSFRNWRNQLESKTDSVVAAGTRYEITTSAEDGSLASVMIGLDKSDLHAVASRFEFRGHDAVNVVELPAEDASLTVANTSPLVPAPGTHPAAPSSAPDAAKPETVAAATASDELQVFLRLRRMGADLGEPVEVERTGPAVTVRAAGLDPSRQQELKNMLADLPRVVVNLSELPTSPLSVISSSSSTTVRAGASPSMDRIQQFVGGRPAFERLSSQVLDSSDRAMARAHALRRLAERFPVQAEASMDSTSREQLATLRREHTAVLEREAESLRASIGPVLTALGAADPGLSVAVPATWQEGALRIFDSALSLDRQLSATFGASASQNAGPAEMFTELVRLNGLLQAYHQK